MDKNQVVVITGSRKGIGRYLVEYYLNKGCKVIGCSREPFDVNLNNYRHYCLDVANETKVKQMFVDIRKMEKRLDILINNAGIASMNHVLLMPLKEVRNILDTNFVGTFLCIREAAKLMQKNKYGRIVNFATIASVLKLEGEAVYAASKAAIINLTQILARELAAFGITVNAVGPTPVRTDLIRSVPQEKIEKLIQQQAIQRFGEYKDVANVIDFFIRPESDFITGQTIFLGGV